MSDQMHEHHDLDLIAALAEGTLDDTSVAEELVAACPECAEALAVHRMVLEAIRHEERPQLTDLERQRLRTSIWAETQPAAAPSGGTPWWYRLAGAAAALVVVVGVVSMVTGGGDDAGSEILPIAADTAYEDAGQARDGEDTMTPMAEMGDDDAQEDGGVATMESADTTAPASTDVAAADADETASVARTTFRSEDLADATERFADRVREEPVGIDDGFACRDTIEMDRLMASEAVVVDDEEAWFVALGDGDSIDAVAVLRAAECTVLFESPAHRTDHPEDR